MPSQYLPKSLILIVLTIGLLSSKYGQSTFEDAGLSCASHLRIHVSEKGKYLSHTIEKNCHPLVTELMEVFVKDLVFYPAKENGQAIASYLDWKFRAGTTN